MQDFIIGVIVLLTASALLLQYYRGVMRDK